MSDMSNSTGDSNSGKPVVHDQAYWDSYPAISSEEYPLLAHKHCCPCQQGYPLAACECAVFTLTEQPNP